MTENNRVSFGSDIYSAWNIQPKHTSFDATGGLVYSGDNETPPSEVSYKNLEKYVKGRQKNITGQKHGKYNSFQIQQIGHLLSDTLMKMIQQKTLEEQIFAIIFACDMSGFHIIAEKFQLNESGGVFRLTACLNNFLGSLIEIIYHYKGDVLKISGDSLMAMWQLDQNQSMEQILHKAIECSLYIQKNLGKFHTDVENELKVKIGISAGNIIIRLLGTADFGRSLFVIGQPIIDAKYAEMLCSSGDVIISASAWALCTSFLYKYEELNSHFIKVLQIISSDEIKNDFPKKLSTKGDDNQFLFTYPRPIDGGFVSELRKNLDDIPEPDILYEYNSFILPFILKQIRANRALDIVSEMCYVTIVIIRVQLNSDVDLRTFLNLCNETFTLISRQMKALTSCLTRSYNYDNDILFFIVFGLKGYLGPPPTMAALRSSYQIYKELLMIKNIKSVSVAISSGILYCGLMGHPERKEYSVIGFPVLKARKMMLTFPSCVICDRATYQNSRLPEKRFTKRVCSVEHGIKLSGIYYSYEEVDNDIDVDEEDVPLFDRQDEMKEFKLLIERHSKVGIILYGEEGSGKSRLLEEFSGVLEQRNKTTIRISIQTSIFNAPFSAIKYIFDKIIYLDHLTEMRREICLAKLVNTNYVQIEDLCYLNSVLDVKYPETLQYQYDMPRKRFLKSWSVFKGLVRSLEPKNLALILDNGENIDTDSWNFIGEMTNYNNMIILISINSFEDPVESTVYRDMKQQLIKMHRISICKLETCWLAPLACQILNVQAIDRYLERILMSNSDGNPKWCETFLISQKRAGGIRIKLIPRDNLNPMKYVSESAFKGILEPSKENPKVTETIKVASLVKKINIIPRLLTKKLENIFLIIFDDMNGYEQQLLKCASVIGFVFRRALLVEILPHETDLQTAQSIQHLYELNMLVCGSLYSENVILRYMNKRQNLLSLHVINCHCDIIRPNGPEFEDMPKYAFCNIIKFSTNAFYKASYELMNDEQKKYFHQLIANTLIINQPLCYYCRNFIKDGRKHSLLPPNTIQDILTSNRIMKKYTQEIKKKLNMQSDINAKSSLCSKKPKKISFESKEIFKNKKFDLKDYFCSELRNGTENILIDFSQCECIYIQATTFEAIYYHLKSAGALGQCIYYLFESTKRYIRLQNISKSTNQLKTAFEIIQTLSGNEKKYYTGVYHMLLGMINNQEWHLKLALSKFLKANTLFKCLFSTNGCFTSFIIPFYKTYLLLSHNQNVTKTKNRWALEASNNLNELYGVFMKMGKYKLALKAALIGLIYAEVGNGLMELHCRALSNIIEVCTYLGKNYYLLLLLRKKLRTGIILIDKANSVEPLIAIGRFYSSMFLNNLIIGELKKSIVMANMTLSISKRTPRNVAVLMVLPLMVQAMMMAGQIWESVFAMKELAEYYCDYGNAILTANVWYHALSLDMILDTGFQNIHIHEILQFAQNSYDEIKTISLLDQDAKTRLFANVWVYHVRRGNWNVAKRWAPVNELYEYTGTFSNLLTFMKYLEGTIIKFTSMSFADSQEMKIHEMNKMKKLLKLINHQTHIFKVLRPRYLFLMAYLKCLQNKMQVTKNLITKAIKLCEQTDNKKDLSWILHNYYLWTNRLNVLDRDFWIDNSGENKKLPLYRDYLKVDWMRVMYTLPVMHTQENIM